MIYPETMKTWAMTQKRGSCITAEKTLCIMSFIAFFMCFNFNDLILVNMNCSGMHISKWWGGIWINHVLVSKPKPCFRYAIERLIAGVRPVVPLTLTEIQRPLGPRYSVGFYGWDTLSGRRDNCRIRSWELNRLQRLYSRVRRRMERSSFEVFGNYLNDYHGPGHLNIGWDCRTSSGRGVMWHSEVSARDPIFYRWHTYLENIVQEYRDTQYPK